MINTFSDGSTQSENAVLSSTHDIFAWVPTILSLAGNHPGYTTLIGDDLMWHESDTASSSSSLLSLQVLEGP